MENRDLAGTADNKSLDDGTSIISVTCSLASTRISSNMTCDDLPGPGRIIDTYFYQPAGRYLESRINSFLSRKRLRKDERHDRLFAERHAQIKMELNRIVVSNEIQDATSGINDASAAMTTFFDVIFSQMPEKRCYPCNHLCWIGSKRTSIRLDLSEYLYVCGAQNIGDWGDQIVSDHSARLMHFVPSPYFQIRVEAICAAFFLLDSFPRLRRYFNLSVIRRALRDCGILGAVIRNINQESCCNIGFIGEKLESTFDETHEIDGSLRSLSKKLPRERISTKEFASCIPALLAYAIDCLHHLDHEMPHQIAAFFCQLLGVRAIFEFHEEVIDWNSPVLAFWRTVKYTLSKRSSLPDPYLADNICYPLRWRLRDTLRSFLLCQTDWQQTTPNMTISTSGLVTEFAQLCLEVLCNLFETASSVNGISDPTARIDDARHFLVKQITQGKFAIDDNELGAAWETCCSSVALEMKNQFRSQI